MKHILISAMVVALLAGCAGSNKSNFNTVQAPKATPAVKPYVDALHKPVDDVRSDNRMIADSVKVLRAQIAAAQDDYDMAKAEADRLIDANGATKEQLTQLTQLYGKVGARNLFLEKSTSDLSNKVIEQNTHIEDLGQRLAKADEQAALKDYEVNEFVDKLTAANATITDANGAIDKATKRAVKAEVDAASANTYKRWVLGGAFLLTLLWVGKGVVALMLKRVII